MRDRLFTILMSQSERKKYRAFAKSKGKTLSALIRNLLDNELTKSSQSIY